MDTGAPVERARRLQIFGRVIERAVVDGIDGHRAVITPAVEVAGLRARAGEKYRLGLHFSKRIRRAAASEADARIDTATRDAVTHGDVAGLVHGDTAHPARAAVGRERALLHERGRAAGEIRELIPANARGLAALVAAVLDRMVDDRRFSGGRAVAVREAIHQ